MAAVRHLFPQLQIVQVEEEQPQSVLIILHQNVRQVVLEVMVQQHILMEVQQLLLVVEVVEVLLVLVK
jgi:hypothetical protein